MLQNPAITDQNACAKIIPAITLRALTARSGGECLSACGDVWSPAAITAATI